jgi:hypothetical protein
VKTTDAQVRKMMEEMSKHGKVGLAALRAGMDRGGGSVSRVAARMARI